MQKCINWCQQYKLDYHSSVQPNNIFLMNRHTVTTVHYTGAGTGISTGASTGASISTGASTSTGASISTGAI